METLYDVDWKVENGNISDVSVVPIKVLRRGILEGCTKESITAVAYDGHRFNGNPDSYFTTEKAAWDFLKRALTNTLEDDDKYIAQLSAARASVAAVLARVEKEHPCQDTSA